MSELRINVQTLASYYLRIFIMLIATCMYKNSYRNF